MFLCSPSGDDLLLPDHRPRAPCGPPVSDLAAARSDVVCGPILFVAPSPSSRRCRRAAQAGPQPTGGSHHRNPMMWASRLSRSTGGRATPKRCVRRICSLARLLVGHYAKAQADGDRFHNGLRKPPSAIRRLSPIRSPVTVGGTLLFLARPAASVASPLALCSLSPLPPTVGLTPQPGLSRPERYRKFGGNEPSVRHRRPFERQQGR